MKKHQKNRPRKAVGPIEEFLPVPLDGNPYRFRRWAEGGWNSEPYWQLSVDGKKPWVEGGMLTTDDLIGRGA